MVVLNGLAASTPDAEIADNLLVQKSRLDQAVEGSAAPEGSSSPPKDRRLLAQLLHNLMLALGAWHV